MSKLILVYITCKDKKEAVKISNFLLNSHLAACTNIFPIHSFYWWNSKIQKDREVVVIAKTIEKHYSRIKKEIKQIHSYQIPCILKIKSEANKDYSDWVKKNI